MFPIKHSAQQPLPIDLPKEQLPAMYDLLGVDSEEAGKVDRVHH